MVYRVSDIMGFASYTDISPYASYWESVINPKRKRTAPSSLTFNDSVIYRFDPKTGALKINHNEFPEGAVKQMSKNIRRHPKGIEFSLSIPFFGYDVLLKGIKYVGHLSAEESKPDSE